MTESVPCETKPKKMVNRNVAIALGIICIIVIVSLSGLLVYYVKSLSSEISDRDNTISDSNSQILNLQGQLSSMTAIANLNVSSEYWSPDISGMTGQGYHHYVKYAGYIFVHASSIIPSFNASVELSYSLPNGITYYKGVILNETQNTAWFPVFPAYIDLSIFSLTGVEINAIYYY